jgi:hypothetical protein
MKSIFITLTTLLVFSFGIHSQIIIHKQSFNKGLGAWPVNSPPNYVSPHDWRWYNNTGEASNPDSLGGLRSKHPSDSSYVASPAILLEAGKTYTVSFKTRMDQGSTDRLLTVGTNTRRSLVGTNRIIDIILKNSKMA